MIDRRVIVRGSHVYNSHIAREGLMAHHLDDGPSLELGVQLVGVHVPPHPTFAAGMCWKTVSGFVPFDRTARMMAERSFFGGVPVDLNGLRQ